MYNDNFQTNFSHKMHRNRAENDRLSHSREANNYDPQM